jgi:hypothetical protein
MGTLLEPTHVCASGVLHHVDNCRARRACATIGQEREVEVGLARDSSGCQPNDADLRLSTDAVIGRLDNWKRPAAPVKLADNRTNEGLRAEG